MKALTNQEVALIIKCNLRRIQNQSILTKERVAELAHISMERYNQYETGAKLMNFCDLVKIANALEVKTDDLLDGILDFMKKNN
ncbi:MAG: helix-turn-helix transcriptional regulator [Clostridia bacterium]|nr:helix-turn-helix transcriptional regulator [Clostridia bacterium]